MTRIGNNKNSSHPCPVAAATRTRRGEKSAQSAVQFAASTAAASFPFLSFQHFDNSNLFRISSFGFKASLLSEKSA